MELLLLSWNALYVLAFLLSFWLIYRKFYTSQGSSTIKLPAGSHGWPLVGESVSLFLGSPLDFLTTRRKRFGGVFSSNLLGSPTIVTTTVEAAKFFLSCAECGPSGLFGRLFGPESISQAVGSDHALYRRIMLGMMVPEVLKHHVEKIDNLAQEILESWGSKKTVSVMEETVKFSYCTVIGFVCQKLLPTTPDTIDLMRDVQAIETGLLQFPIDIPFSPYHKALQARARLHTFLDGLINERRAQVAAKGETHKDALGEFVTHKDDKVGTLSNQQVEDNLMALLFGGHHTTALALLWLIKYLHENPQAFKEVEEEQKQVLLEKGSTKYKLTWEDTKLMPATLRAVHETLRLSNVVGLVTRKITKDISYNGYTLPKDWMVHVHMSAIHLDESIYPNATRFDPSRFKVPAKTGTFIPFGSGQRTCPGSALAKLELCIFIHRLITKYRWEPVNPNSKTSYWPMPTVNDGYLIQTMSIQ
ncbi:abscisic acid 8'-hydroxylase 1 [Selaginella moellendorffii]|uniref:abscisic acid 8'-hydroxylase 1 n=1 Tax=Selaginella moellendorffii TaxID=88036 RepID=UPI000D1C6177|nr:abscisic acid 8'-hydroxylase 1 [Selaginella moellendorffii]|eukprot:XP_002967956.2 abscisic acid 8'-hydroxylase 1 [Selaginella moellendorffii]